MTDLRKRWLDVVTKWRLNPEGPGHAELWCEALEACSRSRLQEIQQEKLEVLLPYLYEHSAFYREKLRAAKLMPSDIKSLDDLPKIPLTTKEEMTASSAQHPPWGSYEAIDDKIWAARGWMVFATGGTTAAPRLFRHTVHDREQWTWNYARGIWATGIRPGMGPMLIALGYSPHTFGWGVHHACGLLGIPLIPGGSLDTARRIHLLQTVRPAFLCSTPSYCNYLASQMVERGIDPAGLGLRYLLVAGEPGATIPATKKRLEALWGARVVELYGITEGSPAPGGYQCTVTSAIEPYSDHLMEDVQIWELVDPDTLEPVGEGQRGVTVVTNLYSEATPLLRFLVGDYTVFSHAPCACGRTHKRAIGGFVGRADDMLKIRGVAVFPSAIEDALRAFDELEGEFEIVVGRKEGLDSLTIRAEVKPDVPASEHAALRERITDRIRTAIEVRPDITLIAAGSLERPQFKARRVRIAQ